MTGTISRDINELGPQLRALAAENFCNDAVLRLQLDAKPVQMFTQLNIFGYPHMKHTKPLL